MFPAESPAGRRTTRVRPRRILRGTIRSSSSLSRPGTSTKASYATTSRTGRAPGFGGRISLRRRRSAPPRRLSYDVRPEKPRRQFLRKGLVRVDRARLRPHLHAISRNRGVRTGRHLRDPCGARQPLRPRAFRDHESRARPAGGGEGGARGDPRPRANSRGDLLGDRPLPRRDALRALRPPVLSLGAPRFAPDVDNPNVDRLDGGCSRPPVAADLLRRRGPPPPP